MRKDDLVYVGDMLDNAREAAAIARGKAREEYDADRTLQLALTHLVQVIGEAAGKVAPGLCEAHPEIPWSDIVGMRHRIVHDYADVDEDVVWEVVRGDLPPLIEALEKIVPAEDNGA